MKKDEESKSAPEYGNYDFEYKDLRPGDEGLGTLYLFRASIPGHSRMTVLSGDTVLRTIWIKDGEGVLKRAHREIIKKLKVTNLDEEKEGHEVKVGVVSHLSTVSDSITS